MAVAGDKIYGSDKLRAHWRTLGVGVCIPPKRNRLVQHPYM